jgi:hypothetical protein
MAADAGFLNAPIPGMSLTTEPGNRPWENPPKMTTVEEALDYYSEKIFNAESHDDLLDVLEGGVPVRNVANLMQTVSVMDGTHTLDVGFLVAPAIEEMLMAVADAYNVEYVRSLEDEFKKNIVSRREARRAFEDSLKKKPEEEQPTAGLRGLMAKPKKELEE